MALKRIPIKQLLFFALICGQFISIRSWCQPLFGQHEVSKIMMFYNPGYTGIKANLNFVGDLRYYGENDYISHFLADGRLGRFDSIRQLNPSAGIHYRNDVIGPIIQQYYGIRLANSFKLKKGHKLSAGLLYDYVKTDIQKSQFRAPDGLVGSNIQDPTIVATKEAIHMSLGWVCISNQKERN